MTFNPKIYTYPIPGPQTWTWAWTRAWPGMFGLIRARFAGLLRCSFFASQLRNKHGWEEAGSRCGTAKEKWQWRRTRSWHHGYGIGGSADDLCRISKMETAEGMYTFIHTYLQSQFFWKISERNRLLRVRMASIFGTWSIFLLRSLHHCVMHCRCFPGS